MCRNGYRRKWGNVNNDQGKKNYRSVKNDLKTAIFVAKKKYLESVCEEIMEFKRAGRYDLTYMKTNELGG